MELYSFIKIIYLPFICSGSISRSILSATTEARLTSKESVIQGEKQVHLSANRPLAVALESLDNSLVAANDDADNLSKPVVALPGHPVLSELNEPSDGPVPWQSPILPRQLHGFCSQKPVKQLQRPWVIFPFPTVVDSALLATATATARLFRAHALQRRSSIGSYEPSVIRNGAVWHQIRG